MISRSRRTFIAVTLVAAITTGLNAADKSDPCRGQFLGALLVGNVLDISLTTKALHLLNGREDPKLRRLLEWRLLTGAADARRHIDEGATVDSATLLEGWTAIVEKASIYIVEHDLDKPPAPEDHQGIAKPSANLAAVKKWLSKQSSSPPPSSH